MASETLADIVKELRRQSDEEHASATKLRRTDDDVDFAIASCYAEDAKYLSQIADRIEEAWRCEREEWSSRLADAHEVAEDLKNTLTKALDTLAWLKSAESPAARGCGENGGGSSRKTESEAK